MDDDLNYIEVNRLAWNKKTEAHLRSEFYDVKGFLDGKTSLKEIELKLLGDVKDKNILHLQCHFGLDTLSLARLGAKVTGVDLSDKAIESAKQLSKKINTPADFVCCDLYALPQHLKGEFDVVFTSYGTIGWLPDLDKWANVIRHFLKPGGKFLIVDFHPVVWMFDNDFTKISYNYFNAGPIIETESGTYADRAANLSYETVGWNHPTSEVMSSLIKAGLNIIAFEEYDYSPYDCFRGMEKVSEDKFRIKHLENKIPMVFALVAGR